MASGELVGAIAMTEPGAGSDLQAIKTRAVRDGEHYVLNGSKTFISNGLHAGLVGVVAKTDPAEGLEGHLDHHGRDAGPAGLPGRPRARQDRAERLGHRRILLRRLPRARVANLLGPAEGQGFVQLMRDLPYERTLLALGGVGAMEYALQLTVEYTRGRKAFGACAA